jgi:adenylate kinase family enzyme
VVKLLKRGIETYGKRRYLFDGFPRNQENWEEFEKQLAGEVVVRNLIYFDCPSQVLVDRIMERAKTSGRSDDNPDTIKKRLDTFTNETVPIVKSFEEKNNCIRVDATKTVAEVYEELKNKLTQANVFPPSPAQMIFVLGGPGSGKGTYSSPHAGSATNSSRSTTSTTCPRATCCARR